MAEGVLIGDVISAIGPRLRCECLGPHIIQLSGYKFPNLFNLTVSELTSQNLLVLMYWMIIFDSFTLLKNFLNGY